MNAAAPSPLSARELTVSRDLPAAPEQIFKAWRTRLPEWWAPKPVTTISHEIDLRPGGLLKTVMKLPDGTEMPTSGVCLEVVENERIVFTDAFGANWEPNPAIFFVVVVTLAALPDGKTRYTARAMHWTEENCRKHAEMGFEPGWGQVMEQLGAVAATL